ncbi:MAG: HD domain-containing protein [candidate division Zixibacteria bacterium]|nr:HD domain-containing protein [candidate division Zixibacteria bacterium]
MSSPSGVKSKEKAGPPEPAGDLKRELVNGFFVLFRTAELYAPSHPSYQKQAEHLLAVIAGLQEREGSVLLETLDGHLFVNEARLKFDFEGFAASKFVVGLLTSHNLGGFSFEPGLGREELDRFVTLFKKPPDELEGLADLFAREKIARIVPKQKVEKEDPKKLEKLEGSRAAARKTFVTAVSLVETTMATARAGKGANLNAAKRVVQELVDQIVADEAALMELAALKHYDGYTYAHSVNVAVLSISLGTRLGLDKKSLALLGFGALFHDIGKVKLPADLVNKPSQYNEDDWKQMRRHPVFGAKTVILTRGTDDYTGRAVEIAFLHHVNYDKTGYPELSEKTVPGIFPMIVKICDSFNALSSGRIYFNKPFSPDEVIQKLIAGMGTQFDPLLLKIFVSTVGVFPIGSLVLLDTGEVGIVYKTNPENIYRPKVRVIAEPSGTVSEFRVVDLSERDQNSGQFIRNIKRLLNSHDYGLDLSKFLYV